MKLLFSLKRADAISHNEIYVKDGLAKIESARELYYKGIQQFNNYLFYIDDTDFKLIEVSKTMEKVK